MRIELRPYKRNQGARPYLELRKQDEEDQRWYDFFYERYYQRLWDDSKPLVRF